MFCELSAFANDTSSQSSEKVNRMTGRVFWLCFPWGVQTFQSSRARMYRCDLIVTSTNQFSVVGNTALCVYCCVYVIF